MSRRRKIIVSLIVIVLIAAIVLAANVFMRNSNITNVEVVIDYGKSDTLIVSQTIKMELASKFGDMMQLQIKNVEVKEIENYLDSKPYVEKSDVYIDMKGKIEIKVKQSEPIVRVYSKAGQYYIDKTGKLIPVLENTIADVAIATGNINPQDKKIIEDLYNISLKLSEDTTLVYQIDQINVINKDNIELYPKVGDYVIKLGSVENLDTKLTKLKYLYKDGFTRQGWDNYSVVNLCFNNQVVCTRK